MASLDSAALGKAVEEALKEHAANRVFEFIGEFLKQRRRMQCLKLAAEPAITSEPGKIVARAAEFDRFVVEGKAEPDISAFATVLGPADFGFTEKQKQELEEILSKRTSAAEPAPWKDDTQVPEKRC